MSDVVLQGLITNGFWLIIFFVAILFFRREVGFLLSSLASLKVFGASFEIRDAKSALEYYAVFSSILEDILSKRQSAEKFYEFVSDNGARQLVKFTLKYMNAVRDPDIDIEVLKNIALLVGRKGNYQVAIRVYDTLLKREEYKDDFDLFYLKSRMLRDSRNKSNLLEAEDIYDNKLVEISPHSGVSFGRARTKSLLGKYDQSLIDLREAIALKYWKNGNENMLESDQLKPLEKAKPTEFAVLRAELKAAMEKDQHAVTPTAPDKSADRQTKTMSPAQ